jgi:uncharacterized protein (DUF58 family)
VTGETLVTLSEIAEIELFILKRMKEFTLGDHASVFKGGGFNFVGVRDWQPGDRMSSIDWAQSSMTNFSPLITRDFEQDSTATIVAVADASLSTRCGIDGYTIATAIARGVAAVGLSATFFQDLFGFVAFDGRLQPTAAARPRIGRSHLLYCLDLYRAAVEKTQQGLMIQFPQDKNQTRFGFLASRPAPDAANRSTPAITLAIESQLRKAAMVPVISDFLFPDAPRLIAELASLNAVHDVFVLMADVRFAYEVPDVSAGWIEAFDIESGETRVLSRRELRRLGDRVAAWQEDIVRTAGAAGLDVVRVGLDRWEMETALATFAAERRLRKM